MLKNLVLILTLVLIGFTSQSQILISIILGDKLNSDGLEFGLDGGLNLSQMTGLESRSYATDLHLGFYFDIRIKNQWNLNTGVLVKSSQGSSKLSRNDVYNLYPELGTFVDSGNYSQSLGYFNVPIMIKYKFKNHIYIQAGTQLGYLTKAQIHYHHRYENIELNTTTGNRSAFKKLDAGLIGGLGYKLRKGKGMNMGIKYYYGLVDITQSTTLNTYNSAIYFKVDIPIGKEKEI